MEGKVVLVVGTHPLWKMDVDEARVAYPDADVCVVNDAGALIQADHLATCHPSRLSRFMQRHIDAWPEADIPKIHINAGETPDSTWPARVWFAGIGGGSAPFAAMVMLQNGYDLVIMCGCPLNGGDGYAIKGHGSSAIDPRIGMVHANHEMVEGWHSALWDFKERQPATAAKIRSMSGVTKEIFGGLHG